MQHCTVNTTRCVLSIGINLGNSKIDLRGNNVLYIAFETVTTEMSNKNNKAPSNVIKTKTLTANKYSDVEHNITESRADPDNTIKQEHLKRCVRCSLNKSFKQLKQ